MTAINALWDAMDELRDAQDAKSHYEKEAGLFGSDLSKEISDCDVRIERIKNEISLALEVAEIEESITVQRELIARYASKLRMDVEKAGYWFAKSYAAKFRALWNQ